MNFTKLKKKKKRGGRGEWEWGGDDNIGKYVLFFA